MGIIAVTIWVIRVLLSPLTLLHTLLFGKQALNPLAVPQLLVLHHQLRLEVFLAGSNGFELRDSLVGFFQGLGLGYGLRFGV